MLIRIDKHQWVDPTLIAKMFCAMARHATETDRGVPPRVCFVLKNSDMLTVACESYEAAIDHAAAIADEIENIGMGGEP